ncbi:MAG: aldo/keto reductase, partial [Pseudomonadota bacterium]
SKQHDFVASTIVGASTAEQMPEILAAANLILDEALLLEIDKVSNDILYPMG